MFQTTVVDGVVGYSDKLLSVVALFRNNGAPEGFNAQSMAGKSKKGAVALRLFAVIDPDTNTFERVGFKARGCLAMTACASMICMMLEGRSLEEALSITPEALAAELDAFPPARETPRCSPSRRCVRLWGITSFAREPRCPTSTAWCRAIKTRRRVSCASIAR